MVVEIRILGRVDAIVDGRSVPLRRRKQRAVLAMLALRANHTVGADELIDGLWGDRPPQTAAKNLQSYVSQLRKALAFDDAGASIVTRGRGYELRVAEEAVDALRFEDLVEEAAREPSGAANGLASAALKLWHGAPLADVASEPFAGPEIGRLEELHLRAIELAIESELAAGRHDEVIARLEELIAKEPLRERIHAQRMLALYRAGRQSEALDAYRRARETLVEQIGVEPGPELQRLQEQILTQDPALEAAPPAAELPVQLEGGSPLLAGRERELDWLRTRWARAREGRIVCVMVWGPTGIGKTRLVAELAQEVRDAEAAVLYAGGGEVAEAALATLAEAGKGHRPTLLVLDYADDAPPAVLEAAAALARTREGRPLLICLLHHDQQGPPAFAGLLEGGAAQRLRLDPLSEDAAAEIAALYAPAEGVAMPLETLIVESAGVPLRIHRAAGEWARGEAAERLAATADIAADDRTGLRTAQAAIAGGVVDLQTADERTRLYAVEEPPDPSEPEICPYRGLAPFDAAHAEYFFGRERLVAELVARLVGSTLLAVVGPSGSGKSSAVRAGLLSALASGVVPGSERWRRAVMRPGERPLAELSRTLARAVPETGPEGAAPWIADALCRLPAGERIVLAVDQFEEVFVACRDEAERRAFLDALVEGAGDPEERLIVVVAIRADFYGRCAAHADLSTLVSANQVLVGPMRRDELRRAIELPARRTGLRVEPRLISALVGDVAEEPGGLPLLSAALVELWQHRDGRTLRHRAYERIGGVEGAVARLAEDAYQRLGPAERLRARPMLLRLAGAGDEAEALVRRRVALDELELDRDEHAARALDVLTESRLLTVDEGEVEVAHEALLREWPRLRSWLAEDAEGRRLHQHLIGAARGWRDSGRDPAELYRGARLASALEWASTHEREPNEHERAFLDESRAASEREAERQRRANRRLRALLAGVGVLLAAALVAGVIALSERQGARDATTVADARRLAAQALSEEQRDQALRLATAGVALDDSPATRSSLLSALVRDSPALGVLNVEGKINSNVALSPDGTTLATGGGGGKVILFNTETGERVGEYQAPDQPLWLAFDPRGRSLAIFGAMREGRKGYLDVIEADTQRRLSSALLGRYPADPGTIYSPSGAYAPDGRSVIVQYAAFDAPAAHHMFLRRFDPRTGSPIGPAVRVAPRWNPEYPTGPSLTPDGRLLISEAGVKNASTYAIDADTLRVVRRYPAAAYNQAVSPDGDTLELGGRNGRVRLLDLASGRVRALTGGRHDGPIYNAAFSPDGKMLATGGADGKVIVWNVSARRAIETLGGHKGYSVNGVAFSPDGRLYTASRDMTVRIWDVAGFRRVARPFRTNSVNDTGQPSPPAFAPSPDGHTLAVARRDGRVDLIDAETLRRTGGFEAFADRPALAIEYSPDGSRLAVAGGGGGVGIWDAGSGKRVGPLLSAPHGPRRHNPHSVQALAFGPGGLLAAAGVGGFGSGKGAVRIWDLAARKLIDPPLHLPPYVTGLAFSPDGSRLAIPFGARHGGRREGVHVLDVRSDQTLARLRGGQEFSSVAFSPDGSLLAGGELDGNVLLWATDGWGPVGAPVASGGQFSVAFSPDGRTLATSGNDGAVALWDVASQQPIGPPLPGLPKARTTARFTPDGDRLFALSNSGRAIRWEVDPEVWLRQACMLAGGLTPEQWAELVPGQDYRLACPSG